MGAALFKIVSLATFENGNHVNTKKFRCSYGIGRVVPSGLIYVRNPYFIKQAALETMQTTTLDVNAEAEELSKQPILEDKEIPSDFQQFHFCCYSYDPLLSRLLILIIEDIFPQTVEIQRLCRFILTVRQKCPTMPYHDWHHAFHTVHCMWQMIKSCHRDTFTEVEKMSLIIGALCHNLEHRRYSANHLCNQTPPLAALYSSSTIDDSYKQTVIILHMEGNEICSSLTIDDHRKLLDLTKLVFIHFKSLKLLNDKSLNLSKFKACADDQTNVTQNLNFVLGR